MDLWNLWKLVEADLVRARSTLPESAASDKTFQEYQDFLGHNELELACEMLEAYAEDHPVTTEFWLALRDAATKMQLSERAKRYELRAANG
ncbi:MAG TPA: hypothetical protein VH475_07350 [Tepidisphaeraceae bacterium]|jgi:hypothetical protein